MAYIIQHVNGNDYVQEVDGQKSTFNSQRDYAQKFDTREAADEEAKKIPGLFKVVTA